MKRYSLVFLLTLLTFVFAAHASQNNAPLQLQPQKSVAQPLKQGVMNASEELADIKGPMTIPDNSTRYPLLVGAALVLFILVLIVLLRRKKTTKQRLIPAHQTALRKLESARELIDEHKVDEFTTLIDHTLRSYIEQRFSISARRQTSREFIETITHSTNLPPVLNENSSHLLAWQEQLDMVKFAKADLAVQTMEKILSGLRTFIESTKAEDKQ